ncbi:MAG: family 1 glycosylhydrolase [Chitinivibrionales bacterium]|nr:family 1 glycosylhydrolase [Chitinivibrionales bacterium]
MYDIFSLPDTSFPPGFLWGSATAGHQIEGDNINSQLWPLEQSGRKPQPSGKACNHWELYRQDIELTKQLGHRAYRMSIEWSRIEPQQGIRDEHALARYIDMLTLLNERDITPWVTLHHFTHPQWFEELGAFHNRKNLACFERHLDYLVPRISDLVGGWNVINEFNFSRHPMGGMLKMNFIKAHALGYHLIRRHSNAPVGSAHAFTHWFPRRGYDSVDNRIADYADFITNEFWFHAIRTGELVYPHLDAEYDPDVKDALDFWSVNYYSRTMADGRRAKFDGEKFRHKELNMIDEEFYLREMFPEGLTSNCERLKDKPIYITENGCATNDDRFRIVYLALHLSALREAIERGADIRGYFHWSTMDNYEWGSFSPRFGLVEVNFETFARTPRPSAWFYKDVIEQNGFDAKLIRTYLNELPTLH